MLSMLQAAADKLCDKSGGVVIDRQDFLGLVNPRDDDGTSTLLNESLFLDTLLPANIVNVQR